MFDDQNALRAIEGLVDAMVTAWNRGDAHAYAANFAEDADFTNVFGIAMHGRTAVEQSHAAILTTMFKDSVLSKIETRVRFVRPDVAAVDVRWHMTGARDPSGKPWPERRGLMSAIATESAGRWSFSVFHNQDLPPPAQVAAAAEMLKR